MAGTLGSVFNSSDCHFGWSKPSLVFLFNEINSNIHC